RLPSLMRRSSSWLTSARNLRASAAVAPRGRGGVDCAERTAEPAITEARAMAERLRPERPFDRLRVVLSNVEGRGAKTPSDLPAGWRPASERSHRRMRASVTHGTLAVSRFAVRGSSFKRMISFSHISKQYGRQVLFVDASFQLNPGEKVGLVGPNGSGKTTLFRMITGEEQADEGE